MINSGVLICQNTSYVHARVCLYTDTTGCVTDRSTKHLQMISSILGMMPVGERRLSKQSAYLSDVLHDNLYNVS